MDIREMEAGRELDCKIAEIVFGYKRVKTPKDYNGMNGGTDVLLPPSMSEFYDYPPIGKIVLGYFAKEWSTNLSASWEVRQWLMDNIGGVTLMSVCDENPEYCEVYRGKYKSAIKVYTKSVPHSLCVAALLAMEDKA